MDDHMMRRTAMKRTGWPRRSPITSSVAMRGSRPPSVPSQPARAVMAVISWAGVAIQKERAIRSEPYRRLVAAMPCINCQLVGFSQAAHLPPDGKGIKQDDRQIFPLCCTRMGIPGCHADYDQYRMFPREKAVEVGIEWAKQTRRQITQAGEWPKNLPKMETE